MLWSVRIESALTNTDLRGFEQALRLGTTGFFLLLAAALAVVHWNSRFYPAGIARAGLVRVLAGWTVAYWSFRSLGFFYRDFNFTFTGAHLAMALVSGAMALTAVVVSLPKVPTYTRLSSSPDEVRHLVDGAH